MNVNTSCPLGELQRPNADGSAPASARPDYKQLLSPYRGSSNVRSLWQLTTTLLGFVLLWALMWVSLHYSLWLTLLLSLPTAGLLVRLFVLQHDCGHGSFFNSRWANNLVGRALSVLTLTPYQRWRNGHAVHHATSGDLDRRGLGDIHMLTVAEYLRLSRWRRFVYRLHRHPLVLFGLGPVLYFVVYQRFAFFEPDPWKSERASVHWTNLSLVLFFAALGSLVGWVPLLWVHVPVVVLGSSAGAWLFYVQHHFEAAYWKRNEHWDYFDAGLEGSSYYVLPGVLQWFTANIALHHIHHLDSQIPNYRLRACFNEIPLLQRVHRITIWQSFSCASLKLWDEVEQRMVGFPDCA